MAASRVVNPVRERKARIASNNSGRDGSGGWLSFTYLVAEINRNRRRCADSGNLLGDFNGDFRIRETCRCWLTELEH